MNQSIEMLGQLLDATAFRHEVLSNNIANVNTPGFTRKDVDFHSALIDALDSPEKMNRLHFDAHDDLASTRNSNNNNVTIQRELSRMTQNSLLYDFAAEMMTRKLSGLRKAISGTK